MHVSIWLLGDARIVMYAEDRCIKAVTAGP